MTERYMRADRVIVVGLWVLVFNVAALTIVGALWGWIGEDAVRLVMVAMIPLTGLAAVLQVRLYAVRVCAVVRATTTNREAGGELHALP